MTDEEWLAAAQTLAQRQSALRGLDIATLRAELARTCRLMLAATTVISDNYHALPEEELAAGAIDLHDRLDRGMWRWKLDARSFQAAARDVGIRARGLDLALTHETGDDGPSERPDIDYYCERSQTYVVPRMPLPWEDGAGARRFFRRRGTPYHRVIPKKIGSFVQELHRLDGFEIAPGIDRPLGAAMFEQFKLLCEGDGDSFRVLGIECADPGRAIDDHVSSAWVARCSAIVWPELTMPPEHVAILRRRLEEEAYSAAPAQGPAWVLAGSWNDGAPPANIAPVLDGYGQPVFDCAKSIPYRETKLGREEMLPGFRVPILVTDRALIAFGICRDFCELGQRTPWADLNVDLVVVASMGNETTMQSHRTAADLGAPGGQRTFVVQQRDETGKGATGWVLPPVGNPGALEIKAMERGSWSEHLVR